MKYIPLLKSNTPSIDKGAAMKEKLLKNNNKYNEDYLP